VQVFDDLGVIGSDLGVVSIKLFWLGETRQITVFALHSLLFILFKKLPFYIVYFADYLPYFTSEIKCLLSYFGAMCNEVLATFFSLRDKLKADKVTLNSFEH